MLLYSGHGPFIPHGEWGEEISDTKTGHVQNHENYIKRINISALITP